MKRLRIAILVLTLPLILAGKGCDKNLPPVSDGKSACEFVKRVFYPQCSFQVTRAEALGLSELNQKKLDAVKLYFRTCPQYKVCLDAKMKALGN